MIEELVLFLYNSNEEKAAITLLDALSRKSNTFTQFDELAKCYFKIKQHYKAFINAEEALKLFDGVDLYNVKYNVINAANHANYPERALQLIKQLELIKPDDVDLILEKAFAHFLMNEKDKAEAILREQLDNPNNDEKIKTKIRFNLGTYELLKDEFQSGLRKFLYEGRKLDYWKKPELPYIFWDGTVYPGKKIYIRTEAGIGDEFINIRFMKHIKELGMNPIWFTDRPDMLKIFNRNGYEATNELELSNNNDIYWAHSMDMPVLLNLEYEDLWHGPYIKSDGNLKEKWKRRFECISPNNKPRIGIRWQGNPAYDQDLHRSLKLDDIMSSINIDANFISLQRDTGLEELDSYDNILDLSDEMKNYEETLGILDNLDLVITSCTSIAHAALAMGKDTIVFTPISSYYTWCHTTDNSPWYGSNLTLLRQEKPRVWDGPLNRLNEIIEKRLLK